MDNKDKKKKSSGTKNLVIFIAIMIASMIFGFCIGAAIAYFKKNGVDFAGMADYVSGYVMKGLPWFYIGISVVSAGMAIGVYLVYSRRAAAWDGESEEEIARIEEGIGVPIGIANAMTIINSLLFSMYVWGNICEDTVCDDGYKVLGIILFLANYIWIVVVSRLTVELEKKINPEKRGDVLEINFQHTWEDSCDEAQKKIIYEAGFRAYRAGTKACTTIWLITFISMFMFDTGLFPVFVVCAIWFIMLITYTMVAGRLEKDMYR